MIEIKNLSKQYNKNKVLALDNISFTLPDKGLIFIVGKSGSGKSTFLNMIGGLDEYSTGSILVDGTDICKLSPNELDNYRNYYIGIVYQYFNLFDNDTVFNNIKVATDIAKDKITEADIDKLFNDLEISEKKNTLVRELSGGQKQRVAIARALIKRPNVILADEPTGNLDSKTSISIYNLLKKISKDKLVIVVSHDIYNALIYADRIIELGDGKVVKDIERKDFTNGKKEISVSDNISDEDIDKINKVLNSEGFFITKGTAGFKKTIEIKPYCDTPISFNSANKSWKNSIKLAFKMFKTSLASFIVTSIIAMFVVSLVSLAHGFTIYDGRGAINAAIEKHDSRNFVVEKSFSYTNNNNKLEKGKVVALNQADYDTFSNEEMFGKSYPIYPIVLYNGTYNLDMFSVSSDYQTLLAKESLGTMVIDKEYMDKVFYDSTVLEGSLEGLEDSTSIVITDYLADCILQKNILQRVDKKPIVSLDEDHPYSELVGVEVKSKSNYFYHTIAAVISTDYKTKYQELYDKKKSINDQPLIAPLLTREMVASDIYLRFVNDLQTRYLYTYSFNRNFLEDYILGEKQKDQYLKNSFFSDIEQTIIVNQAKNKWIKYDKKLNKGEIRLSPSIYEEIFGSSTFEEGHVVHFEGREFGVSEIENPTISKTFNVVGLTTTKDGANLSGFLSMDDYLEIGLVNYEAYALSFSSPELCKNIMYYGKLRFMYTPSESFSAVINLINIIGIFSDIFFFIAVILISLVALIIISHNLRIIKKNQYRFGVYKSLGYSSAALSGITLVNCVFFIVSISLLSCAFSVGLSSVMNKLLVDAFIEYLDSDVISSLTLVSFSMPILSIYLSVVSILTLISTIVPVVSIRRIKPNIIINKAE